MAHTFKDKAKRYRAERRSERRDPAVRTYWDARRILAEIYLRSEAMASGS